MWVVGGGVWGGGGGGGGGLGEGISLEDGPEDGRHGGGGWLGDKHRRRKRGDPITQEKKINI